MKNLLAQLESNETVLLMYLAGELPEQDKAEVEHLLQRDGGMRAQLQQLQSTAAFMDQQFAAADTSAVANPDAVTHSTLRAMRLWHKTGTPRTPIVPMPETSLALPWWCYPLAAAASILLALAAWLASTEPDMATKPIANNGGGYTIQPADWIDDSATSLLAQREAYATVYSGEMAAAFEDTDRLLAEYTTDPLCTAQQQLQQLQQASSEAWD